MFDHIVKIIFILLYFVCQNNILADDNTALRTIEFAGLTWNVKSGGPIGPGPNYWSDSPEDVYVDDQGLHLKISRKGGTWHSAEVYTSEFTTYGEHRFLVEGRIDRMDKNMVLGLFLYAADDAEVDIEYSKWGDASRDNIGGFTIQPYTTPGNNFSFDGTLNSVQSTHIFDWQHDAVLFTSLQGHHLSGMPEQDIIQQWRYTGSDIPSVARALRIHINFWLFRGQSPTSLSVTHIIIRAARFPISAHVPDPSDDTSVPKSMRLYPNYPNPFNGKTVIRYKIDNTTPVNVSIFDTSGRLVAELVDSVQTPNDYHLSWSATDLGSGLYWCRLRTNNTVDTQKMLLLR